MMNDAISRSAVLAMTSTISAHGAKIEVIFPDEVEQLPAIDVAPVVRAKWIDTSPMWLIGKQRPPSARLQCTNCGRRTGYRQRRSYKYCPNCGARMDGESDGN